MKSTFLIGMAFLLPLNIFAQGLTKEDKKARKKVVSRIWAPTMKFLTGSDNRGYDTYYTNKTATATYTGISENTMLKRRAGKILFGQPLSNFTYRQTSGNKFVYFPEGWAYADNIIICI